MSKHTRRQSTDCGLCGRPVEGAFLCDDCTADTEQRLVTLPDLVHAVDEAFRKEQRFSTTRHSAGDVAGLDESPLPFNSAAGRLRRDVTQALLRWVILVHDRGAVPWRPGVMPEHPRNTSESMTARILWAVPWFRTHPEGPDFARELAHLHSRITRLVDRPPDLVYLGECSMPGHFTVAGVTYRECPEDLYAESGAEHVTCRRCRHRHDVAARRDVLLVAVKDQLANPSDIARGLVGLDLEVTPERIRQWKSRGRIVPHGSDRHGAPLLRVGDVIDLALKDSETTTHPARRKDPA